MFRLFWLSAPRWLYTVLYVLMGWAALGWMGAFYASGGLAVLILILAGGLCYTLGAVVYGRKRPDPSPAWFGYHEIFHAGTIAGFTCHYVAISMATYSALLGLLAHRAGNVATVDSSLVRGRTPRHRSSSARRGAIPDARSQLRPQLAARASAEVTGSRQTKCRQTYAVG